MVIKYDIEIDNEAIENNINRITNQIFKLLPNREEGNDWQTPLQNLIIEISGLNILLKDVKLGLLNETIAAPDDWAPTTFFNIG